MTSMRTRVPVNQKGRTERLHTPDRVRRVSVTDPIAAARRYDYAADGHSDGRPQPRTGAQGAHDRHALPAAAARAGGLGVRRDPPPADGAAGRGGSTPERARGSRALRVTVTPDERKPRMRLFYRRLALLGAAVVAFIERRVMRTAVQHMAVGGPPL